MSTNTKPLPTWESILTCPLSPSQIPEATMITAMGLHKTTPFCRYNGNASSTSCHHLTGKEAAASGGRIIDCAITCGSYGHACVFDEPPYPIQSLGAM